VSGEQRTDEQRARDALLDLGPYLVGTKESAASCMCGHWFAPCHLTPGAECSVEDCECGTYRHFSGTEPNVANLARALAAAERALEEARRERDEGYEVMAEVSREKARQKMRLNEAERQLVEAREALRRIAYFEVGEGIPIYLACDQARMKMRDLARAALEATGPRPEPECTCPDAIAADGTKYLLARGDCPAHVAGGTAGAVADVEGDER